MLNIEKSFTEIEEENILTLLDFFKNAIALSTLRSYQIL